MHKPYIAALLIFVLFCAALQDQMHRCQWLDDVLGWQDIVLVHRLIEIHLHCKSCQGPQEWMRLSGMQEHHLQVVRPHFSDHAAPSQCTFYRRISAAAASAHIRALLNCMYGKDVAACRVHGTLIAVLLPGASVARTPLVLAFGHTPVQYGFSDASSCGSGGGGRIMAAQQKP